MREIDHTDDAVHHRVTYRDQAIDRAEGQSVYKLLQEVFHNARHPCFFAMSLGISFRKNVV